MIGEVLGWDFRVGEDDVVLGKDKKAMKFLESESVSGG